MAGGWRATTRMLATAAAAAAVSRAATAVRRLLEEMPRHPQLDGPVSRPSPAQPVWSPAHLNVTSPLTAPSSEDHVIAAQVQPRHAFGSAPVVTPSRGIGFRPESSHAIRQPVAEMPVISRPAAPDPKPTEPETDSAPWAVRPAASIVDEPTENGDTTAMPPTPPTPEEELDPPPSMHMTAPPLEDTLIGADGADGAAPIVQPEPEPEPQPAPEPELRETPAEEVVEVPVTTSAKSRKKKSRKDKPSKKRETNKVVKAKKSEQVKDKKKAKGKHRRHRSAISGTIRSSRGRGLRGIQVTVVDDLEAVIATAVSGANGAFVVEELPAGIYRLTAHDEVDGDFAAGWHAGESFATAAPLKVKADKTHRKADVSLLSTAAIDVDVDIRKKKVVVAIKVTDRSSGIRAGGSVRVGTKLFSADLPLNKGRASITLRGSTTGRTGSPAIPKSLEVDYLGTKHIAPQSHRASLR